MDRLLRIFAVLILIWVSTPVVAADDDDRGRGDGPPPPPPTPPAASNPRPKDGAYNLTIAGFIKNSGSSVGSTVSGDTVDLQCDIVSAQNGQAGKLSVTGMKLSGNYFSGRGTVLGQSAEFKGRLDFPDSAKERTIKGVRLVCTVKSADGKYARVIGYIPALAAAKDNVDSENDSDRGRDKPVHRGRD